MRKGRKHRRYNNYIWVYSIIACICLLTMGVGYAFLSAENNINIDVTKTTPPAADTIKELLGSSSSVSSGTGTLERIEQSATEQTSAQTEYRYRGKNPNNYVTFNGEMWRIIGIVDGKVKLIRNESIGNYAWNSTKVNDNYVNEWPGGTLQVYLNGDYYNSLTVEAKKMIDVSTWYLGESTSFYKTNDVYIGERSTKVYNSDGVTRSIKTTGNIGLMYASDYGYAASNNCSSSKTLFDYDDSICTGSNWLYGKTEWSNTTSLGQFHAFSISSTGHVEYLSAVYSSCYIRPTIYLNQNVKISSGTGSSKDPYQLKIS